MIWTGSHLSVLHDADAFSRNMRTRGEVRMKRSMSSSVCCCPFLCPVNRWKRREIGTVIRVCKGCHPLGYTLWRCTSQDWVDRKTKSCIFHLHVSLFAQRAVLNLCVQFMTSIKYSYTVDKLKSGFLSKLKLKFKEQPQVYKHWTQLRKDLSLHVTLVVQTWTWIG